MRILIVDDETPARERLRRLLSELDGNYQLAGESADGEEALAACARNDVDLVLLDINMPGMNGLEVAGRLADLSPPPAVILVTAYEEHALEAFERGVDDYLVKPVRRERLTAALKRVSILRRPQQAAAGKRQFSQRQRRRKLTAHYRGGLLAVPVNEVIYLQAEHKYVTVRHAGGSILVEESLKSLEGEFADLFMRIHRNALVARRSLTGLVKGVDGGYVVCLRDCDEQLPISRRHLPEIRRWLRSGTN